MEYRAHEIVREYIQRHLDKSDSAPQIEVYTVWKCKALQNWKFLISSSLLDGMYYELTFNGDKGEWYLDAYKKFENQVIQEPKEQPMGDDLIKRQDAIDEIRKSIIPHDMACAHYSSLFINAVRRVPSADRPQVEWVKSKTPKEFRDRMEELSHLDTERRHIEMDACMCDLLTELGYGEGVEIFNSVTLWYS